MAHIKKTFSVGRQIADHAVLANAMRIDLAPDPSPTKANEIASQVVGLIRWYTKQWWIGRDRRYAEAALRNAFPINQRGERTAGVYSYALLYGGLNTEVQLDHQILKNVGLALQAGWRIPLSIDVAFDAVYFHAAGDLRRSILDAATAAERIRDETADRLLEANRITALQASSLSAGTDFLKHIGDRLRSVTGRSFADEEVGDYENLRRLWAARGCVAHGRSPVARFPEGSREVTLDDHFALTWSVFRLIDWMLAV